VTTTSPAGHGIRKQAYANANQKRKKKSAEKGKHGYCSRQEVIPKWETSGVGVCWGGELAEHSTRLRERNRKVSGWPASDFVGKNC